MKHITSEKGSIGELRVTSDLIEKGYPVFRPVSSTSPFDLLVYKNGKYLRVQVKYRRISSKGSLNASMTRHSISQFKITEEYNNFVDIMAIFCPCTNQCYYIKESDFSTHLSLRVTEPKNNQLKNIRFAKDYVNF